MEKYPISIIFVADKQNEYCYWKGREYEKRKEIETTAIKDGVEVGKSWEKFDQDERKEKDISTKISGDTTTKRTYIYTYDDADRIVRITTWESTEFTK